MTIEKLHELADAAVSDKTVSRRNFLKGTGVLVVSFSLLRFAGSQAVAQGGGGEAPDLDGFLAVADDGSVTTFTGKVDLGTGVATALRQIVAEELGVAYSAITWIQGDTKRVPNQGGTWGSGTISRGGAQLRQVAATARQALLRMASDRLGAPVDALEASDGAVGIRGDRSSRVTFGELIGGERFELTVDENAPVKDPATYTVVGRPIGRDDVPGKVTGAFEYVQNVRLPGMLHARVIRPPSANATLASVSEASVRDRPGVVQVVRRGNFLAVVAEREEQAIGAAEALEATWTPAGDTLPADAAALASYMKDTPISNQRAVVDEGDLDTAFAGAARTLSASYEWPFQMHGMIGPSCAVADVRDDSATVWAGTQNPFGTQGAVAGLLGLEPESVRVIYSEASGCYGRLSWDDVPLDAALISQAVGRPVRVQWMRHEEHVYAPKGPPHAISVKAGLDEQGNVAAWEFLDRSLPWVATQPLAAYAVEPNDQAFGIPNGSDGGGEIYAFSNSHVVAATLPWDNRLGTPLRTNNLRAPGDPARTFASETFLDELAEAAGVDPVEYRLRHLSEPRMVAVLQAVAEASDWTARPRPGKRAGSSGMLWGEGLALADRGGTLVATVAQVEVDTSSGKVWVRRVYTAHDCGLIINPDGVSAQIEGNVIQMTGRSLKEEVRFDANTVTSNDWATYPLLTFPEVPEVEVVLVNRPDMPSTGAGEGATVPVAGAIANAIYDATGARLRAAPFTPERVKAALQDAGRA